MTYEQAVKAILSEIGQGSTIIKRVEKMHADNRGVLSFEMTLTYDVWFVIDSTNKDRIITASTLDDAVAEAINSIRKIKAASNAETVAEWNRFQEAARAALAKAEGGAA